MYYFAGGVSLADVFRGLLTRIELINWLDPLRTGYPSPFHRHDIFAWPTGVELQQAWGNIGGLRLVNCLDPRQTGFPQLTEPELMEMFAGPYLLNLAPSYLTSIRADIAKNMPYMNLVAWHNNHSMANNDLPGFVFDQMIPPVNWGATWAGCATPNNVPWEPVRILCLPKIPSRYRANCYHSVVIAFVPTQLPLTYPAPGLSSPSLQRIKMFICGPR